MKQLDTLSHLIRTIWFSMYKAALTKVMVMIEGTEVDRTSILYPESWTAPNSKNIS